MKCAANLRGKYSREMCILSRCIVRCTQIRLSHPTSPARLTVPLRENVATDEKLKHILRASLGAHVCCWTSYCTTRLLYTWMDIEHIVRIRYASVVFTIHIQYSSFARTPGETSRSFFIFRIFLFRTNTHAASIHPSRRPGIQTIQIVRPRDVQMAFLFYFGPTPIRRNLWLQAHFNTNQVEPCQRLVGQCVVSQITMNELSVRCWRRYFIFLILIELLANDAHIVYVVYEFIACFVQHDNGLEIVSWIFSNFRFPSPHHRAMLLSRRKLWLYDASPQNNKLFVMCETRNGRKRASCSLTTGPSAEHVLVPIPPLQLIYL